MTYPSQQKVIVGISGGVDSAVSAYLLREQGYQVSAMFMQNWDADDPHCTAHEDLSCARMVCDHLGIALQTINFSQAYWDRVFQVFLDEYTAGRTPNPDILCNREIKFKAFLEHAKEKQANYIATGHYARITQDQHGYHLRPGHDEHKDQSYFLCMLSQDQLAHSLMPLGTLSKHKVRAIAKDIGLPNWDRKDSTGICFIGKRPFRRFLNDFVLAQPGPIYTDQGKHIGQHDGLMFYTIGQRKGLNIGGLKHSQDQPWYVISKDIPKNRLIVAQGHDHPALLHQQLSAKQWHWINGTEADLPLTCQARIRHGQALQACTISKTTDGYHVLFEQPQRAIAPGQVIAAYQHDQCLGGGVIDAAFGSRQHPAQLQIIEQSQLP
jgi:tRNA-uridine 2-sulfurtransferase